MQQQVPLDKYKVFSISNQQPLSSRIAAHWTGGVEHFIMSGIT
jgi:hypothetical protein